MRTLTLVSLTFALSLVPFACAKAAPATWAQDVEESKVDQAYLDILSCEALESLAQNTALQVLDVEKEMKQPRCKFLMKVDPICRALTQLRKEYMQKLEDITDVGHRNCGWDRS